MDPSEGAKNEGDSAGGGSIHHDGASAMNQPPHGLHPGSMMMGMWSGPPAGSHMMPALQRRSSGGAGQDGDVNLTNYLAARAHAAHMLAAEESRRLEENLMRLEMRRMMTGRSSLGGAATGEQDDAAKGKGEALQSRESQTSNASNEADGSGTAPDGAMTNQDSALMARAQQFNVGGGSQMDMNSLTLSQYQSMMNQFMMNQSMMGFGVPYGLAHLTAAAQGLAMPVHNTKTQAKGEESKEEGKSSKSKGKGKKVEKNPRRPLSAYNIFFSEQRDILLKEAAGEDGDDDAADAASTEGPKDIQAYAEKLMSKRLEKKRPKRVHRKSHGKVAFTALAKTVGAKWRALDEAGKKKYRDIADIDRERYRREKAALGKKVRSNVSRKRAAEELAHS
ncbi:hypothetical protein ACHAXT_008886 [Thalassiosira profunda]